MLNPRLRIVPWLLEEFEIEISADFRLYWDQAGTTISMFSEPASQTVLSGECLKYWVDCLFGSFYPDTFDPVIEYVGSDWAPANDPPTISDEWASRPWDTAAEDGLAIGAITGTLLDTGQPAATGTRPTYTRTVSGTAGRIGHPVSAGTAYGIVWSRPKIILALRGLVAMIPFTSSLSIPAATASDRPFLDYDFNLKLTV